MIEPLHLLYNALWYPALPVALLGGGAVDERLGRATAQSGDDGDPRFWFHAASVGEVEAIGGVVRGLTRQFSDASAIITTMTASGRDAARKRIPEASACLLAPFDWRAAVRSFIADVRPDLLIVAETELWPNYFLEARNGGARVAIVNGRISSRAFGRYLILRPLFARALAAADLVLAQTSADAIRYRLLGARRRRVVVTGNTKFDFALGAGPCELRPALARLAAEKTLLIAGSTAPGEEPILIDAWRRLANRASDLALVIAPRHLKRTEEISGLLANSGLRFTLASRLGHQAVQAEQVIILDTMGELRALYYRAAIAFVGGSLVPGRGGQSLAEPAAAAIPVVFGPFHENQRQIADALLAADGGRVAINAAEIAMAWSELLADEARRRAMGRGAQRALELLGGAVQASVPLLKSLVTLR